MSADLKPQSPLEVKITTKDILIGAFVFAILFWIIGFATMHYPKIVGVI